MSGTKLLGIFQVSVLHDLVHRLYGLVGVVAAAQSTLTRAPTDLPGRPGSSSR